MIDNLKLAISEKDVEKAREILKEELLEKNYPHEIFRDALELASDYDVFDEHDKENLSENPKEWTPEYLEKLKNGLNSNFSKERFMKAYYVSKKIYNSANEEECTSLITLNKKCKDFLFMIEAGAAVVGAVTIGAGLYLLNKKLKNKH